ncbi:MAG: ABC transporter permease [Pseudomonadota bacterium]
MQIVRLALASLFNRRFTAGLTILSVALSVMLFVGVEKVRQGARDSFERTISGTDLIVGARSSAINLVLYSVFRIGDATNNITWDSYQRVAERDDVAWTVPLSLGDSHRGFRVVGTTTEFFERYQYAGDQTLAFADGVVFSDLFDAVIGADVARELGYSVDDPIIVSHGLGDVSFTEHDDKPFRISGVLAQTGTPVDRSVHVSLEAIEAIHLGWQSGVQTPMSRMITPDQARQLNLRPNEITAFLVGMKSRVRTLQAQRDINTYRGEPLQAVIPGVALSQLWQVVGVAERALIAVSLFVVIAGLVSVLISILTSLNERRREMAILRSVGAGPRDVFWLLVSEAVLLAVLGSLLGLGLLYAGLGVAAPWINERYGVALTGLGPGLFDLYMVLGVAGAAFLLGAFPAWRAFRQSLADGLSIKL